MEGEKPTAYFLGLEKWKSKDTTITALKDDTGKILTSNEDILNRPIKKSYFTKIYEELPESVDPIDDFPLSNGDVPT